MNIFLIGINKNKLNKNENEIIYSNITSIVVSFTAFIIFIVLLNSYGWVTPVFVTLGVIIFSNLTLLLNHLGFTLSSRLFLSLMTPFAILAGDILTLIYIPDGTHGYSFDVRVLILASVVLPLLLFLIEEQFYLFITLAVNGVILLLFDRIHLLFGVNLVTSFGAQYYISTIFYAIAFSFIIATLLIFKIRWHKLSLINKKILRRLEEKVLSRTQELKKHTEELVRQNNELEQFSFTVSHNIRGPIARLLGLTTLFNKVETSEHHHIIDHVQLTVVSLDSVISDLNEILQVRNNMYKVKEYVDILEEIKTSHQLLFGSNQEKNLEYLELNIAQVRVFGVKAYIQSILNHLIGNAYKYKREDVKLKIKISTELQKQKLVLKISDNGKGIDLEKFEDKVFKMYSRFDPEIQGKGLGLYLVKQQVEAMNGTISIKSKVNQGTTFLVTLPILQVSQIKHQVYYESDTVSFIYDGVLKTSLVSWKRNPSSTEYREHFRRNMKNVSKYATDFWIYDTTNVGSVSIKDREWFNKEIIPLLLDSNVNGFIIINKEGKGFKSSQWDLFKNICTAKGILLAFKYNIEETNEFILSLPKDYKKKD